MSDTEVNHKNDLNLHRIAENVSTYFHVLFDVSSRC